MRHKSVSFGWRALGIICLIQFALTTAVAAERVLHSFGNGTDGIAPRTSLMMDSAGNLYGTTNSGGLHNYGTAFRMTPDGDGGWTEKVLHSFNQNGVDGSSPSGGLWMDADGDLYGTTETGGTYDCGTVFELIPRDDGDWTEKVVYSFRYNSDGRDGNDPVGRLIADDAGNLYGTTYFGGIHGYGAVFELSPKAGGGWSEKLLHSFNQDGTDAANPAAGLITDSAGNLYGTTQGGGIHSQGTVFELSPRESGGWTEKVLHSFNQNGSDVAYPATGLVMDGAGDLYGTSRAGGIHYDGAVFELTPKEGGGWTEKILHSFGHGTDGQNSLGALALDGAGNLYGTTFDGGSHFRGILFELIPNGDGTWAEQVLRNFGSGTDGSQPRGDVMFDGAGHLYGTTQGGGIHDSGTVFEFTP